MLKVIGVMFFFSWKSSNSFLNSQIWNIEHTMSCAFYDLKHLLTLSTLSNEGTEWYSIVQSKSKLLCRQIWVVLGHVYTIAELATIAHWFNKKTEFVSIVPAPLIPRPAAAAAAAASWPSFSSSSLACWTSVRRAAAAAVAAAVVDAVSGAEAAAGSWSPPRDCPGQLQSSGLVENLVVVVYGWLQYGDRKQSIINI